MRSLRRVRHRTWPIPFGSLILLGASTAAFAGVWQHTLQDPDTTHQQFATNYTAVVELLDGLSVGSGTLIAPRWILTAAHVADGHFSGNPLSIDDHTYFIADVYLHPDWDPNDPDWRFQGKDIALIRLTTDVSPTHALPAPRYSGAGEVGSTAWIVGFGRYGDGLTGWQHEADGVRRAGQNTIDLYGPDWNEEWSILLLVADFDNPEDASTNQTGSPIPNAAEYHPAPGDSGGGWFIDIGGEKQLVAVSSFAYPPTAGGFYGELSGATRVSQFEFWIDTYVQYEKRWKAPASGSWVSDGNWDYESPHEYQAAVFDVDGAYTVTMPSTAATEQLRVEGGSDVTLDGTFNYTITELAALSTGGALRLDAGATVNAGELRVGEYGVGTISQSGGDVHVTGDLFMGVTAGAIGTYHLIDGSLTVDGSVHGRLAGTDDFVLDAPAGALDVAGNIEAHNFIVGQAPYAGIISTFDITHSSVTCDNLSVGFNGTGQIMQIGGTATVENAVSIGVNCGANGTYNLAGGTLVADTINIAFNGQGELNWTDGTILPFTPGGTVTVNVWAPNGSFNIGDGLTFDGVVNELLAEDADNDGVIDDCDNCPDTIPGVVVDEFGCPPPIPGDADSDGDIDLHDFQQFQHCFDAGPSGECPDAVDVDGDGDVDLDDWGELAPTIGGPGSLPQPTDMVLIPAGEFQMGDCMDEEGRPDERPVHTVYIDAFYMGRCEVTNEQYAAGLNWAYGQGLVENPDLHGGVVYKYGGGTAYPYCDTTTNSTQSRITWDGSTFGVVAGKEEHPMVKVTWYGSAAYCNWRSAMTGRTPCYDTDDADWLCDFSANGYRLPTEAEWEKAARGGTPGHRFPWSDQDTIQHTRCNYYSVTSISYDTSPTRGNHPLWGSSPLSNPLTSPAGFFTGALQYQADWGWPSSQTSYQTADGANGYGLYDIAGNAWEWCNDWYSSSYYSGCPGLNPTGPTTGTNRVLRGGSWNNYSDAFACRVAIRNGGYTPGSRINVFGFRCALGTQ